MSLHRVAVFLALATAWLASDAKAAPLVMSCKQASVCIESAGGPNAEQMIKLCGDKGGKSEEKACPTTSVVGNCVFKKDALIMRYYALDSVEATAGLMDVAPGLCQKEGGIFTDKRSGAKPSAPAVWSSVAVPMLKVNLSRPTGCTIDVEAGQGTVTCASGEYAGLEVSLGSYDPKAHPANPDAAIALFKGNLPDGAVFTVLKKESMASSWKLAYQAIPKGSTHKVYGFQAKKLAGPTPIVCSTVTGNEKFLQATEKVCESLIPTTH